MGTRFLVNSTESLSHLPGLDGAPVRIVLPGTQALLMHQALAAVLHAIRGVRFEEQIGLSEVALGKLLETLQVWVDACEYDSNGVIVVEDALGNPIGKFEKDFHPIEIRALRNALEVALLDLGQNEFFTITGFSLAEGKQLLDMLNTALLDPLHLDRQTDSVSH
jgi:hypothetical protein